MTIAKLGISDSMALLSQRKLGRLGCIVDGKPYVVPVNYYFDGRNIYIHSLPGQKITALSANPSACLQVDDIQDAYHWRSVIAYGKYEEIKDERERETVLADIFKRLPHLSPVESKLAGGMTEFIVFRIEVNEITGVGEHW